VSRSDRQRATDILAVADEISAVVNRGIAEFNADALLRRALERCLEIIGEAAKSLTASSRDMMPGVPWEDEIRLRDRLSHHYQRIDARNSGRSLLTRSQRLRSEFATGWSTRVDPHGARCAFATLRTKLGGRADLPWPYSVD
jgi:uncharacterized protein with HEPN domain